MDTVDTVAGIPLSITVTDDGTILNGSVHLIPTDVMAANGIIHVVDGC